VTHVANLGLETCPIALLPSTQQKVPAARIRNSSRKTLLKKATVFEK